MALSGKENMQGGLPLPGKYAELEQKEHPLSTSKIPILSKSRLPPELKQLQQACSSAVNSKGFEISKASSVGVSVVKPAAGMLSKSHFREPLGEMQLSASGHRNMLEDGNANEKEASAVEFVPDAAALASILSNTGLSNDTVSTIQKPSLAQRVPLRGNRACSAITGTGRGSLYTGAIAADPACVSHLSRSASKDVDHTQSRSQALNDQQQKALSMTLENLGPGVEAKHKQPMENLSASKSKDSTARSQKKYLSNVTETGNVKQSNSVDSKEITGTSRTDEEFVPDPAAKASILLNIGLSHSALGAGSKLSMARRVPVKDVRKLPVASGSIRGESLPGPHMSAPPTAKFGRVSCRSTQGLKGLEESGAFRTQLAYTPGDGCSVLDCPQSSLARRVPITHPRSSPFTPCRRDDVLLSSCAAKRAGIRCLTETSQTKWAGEVTPPCTGTVGLRKDATPVRWEKIAVRLFNDGLGASAKKVPAAHLIPSDVGKLQRIEFLARLLQQEIDDGIAEVAPSLEELHKLLSVHCSPALETLQPDLVTPRQVPTSNIGQQAAVSATSVAPTPNTMLTASNSQPACSDPSMHSCGPSISSANSKGVAATSSSVAYFKQRLEDLLDAPRRFHEDCLNDECAFYTSRITTSTQPAVPRCKEPVAKMLDAQDAMHFIPISVPWSPLMEAERSSPS